MQICPQHELCGGCYYQGTPYEEQIEKKDSLVKRFIEDNNIRTEEYHDIVPSPKIMGYRNKMEYTFGNLEIDDELSLGMHVRKRYMSIVTVPECMLVDNDFNIVLSGVLAFCQDKEYSFYHKKTHSGLLRNLVVRKGERTKELLVNIITSSQESFDEKEFIQMLLSLDLDNTIVGIIHTIYDGRADIVACDEMRLLWGRDYYTEMILGLEFKVTAFSFFQTNISAVERLYKDALKLIPDLEGKTVFDLYCGTGTISQALALKAKEVVGIEIIPEAAAAAEINAEINGLTNIRFIAGDVLEALDLTEAKPDIITIDPPRAGIYPKSLKKIIEYNVKEMVYISCNPKTLVYDLLALQNAGYKVKSIRSYDNFPYTKHVETIVLLQRR